MARNCQINALRLRFISCPANGSGNGLGRTARAAFFLFCLSGHLSVIGAGEEMQSVHFSHIRDVGMGNSVFVAGSCPELGNWSPTAAVKLAWNSGNVWSGTVALAGGSVVEYKYVWRSTATNLFCDPSNVTWMEGANLTTNLPSGTPPPYQGKTVYYYTAWTNAEIVYRLGTNWYGGALTRMGEGLVPGEFCYRGEVPAQAGEGLEFVFNGWTGAQQNWDNAPCANPPSGAFNYFTMLDVFHLRQGQIYNYRPPAGAGEPRIESRWVDSTVADISGRTIRIYLPRGYDTNTWKRYPVVYMHDGQNIFYPGGTYGSWDADLTATREISQGRMRECIIVAMDNTDKRQYEYCPPGDRYSDTTPWGIGDKYLQFVLGNVKPTLDYNFRTLPDRHNTVIAGSSMGGLISAYFAYATNVFGEVLAMSPAFSRATNFAASLNSRPRVPRRIYLDTGTAEGLVGQVPGTDYWESPWNGYAAMVRQGYRIGEELVMVAGCGHQHNEWAWQQRLPDAFRFILPLDDEPNHAAAATHPPEFSAISNLPARQVVFRFSALPWQRLLVEQAQAPGAAWSGVATLTTASAWAYPAATSSVTEAVGLLRVQSSPGF